MAWMISRTIPGLSASTGRTSETVRPIFPLCSGSVRCLSGLDGGLLLTEKNGSNVVSASPVFSASLCKSDLSLDVCCWLHVAVELAVKPASANSNAQTYFVSE